MSIILDALKKSERERQRREMPAWAAERNSARAAPRSPRRLYAAVVALGLLAVSLGWGWWHSTRPAHPDANGVVTAAVAAGPSPEMAPSTGNATAVPAGPPSDVRPLQTETSTGTSTAPVPAANLLTIAGLPVADDMNRRNGWNLPVLRIDLHVFAEAPAQRFAYINQQRVTQGAQLASGPRVVAVVVDGAILEYQGQRFALPLQ